jgi:O-methyltransferase
MPSAFETKKILKIPVSFLQMVLPPKIFENFHDFLFPLYKYGIQYIYVLAGRLLYSKSDDGRWQMIERINEVLPYTLVGIGGLEASYKLANKVIDDNIPGDFVELGVARGGCAALLCGVMLRANTFEQIGDRKLWLFDSYEGLPEPTIEDFSENNSSISTGVHIRPLPRGSCLGTLEEVKELLFYKMGFPLDQIRFVQGWFQDTVPAHQNKVNPISLLRLDGDWYESTKICLEYLYDNVSIGGAIIIDDYQSCYGCKRAVDEFLESRSIEAEVHLDGRGGCYFLKTS